MRKNAQTVSTALRPEVGSPAEPVRGIRAEIDGDERRLPRDATEGVQICKEMFLTLLIAQAIREC